MKRRLLVVRLSALGDVIHTLPAVMALASDFDVSWAVERPYAELVQIVAGADPLPVRLKKWSLNRILDARASVRGEFDVAVDFQGLIKSALLTWSSDARERFGFAREFVREKQAAWFYTRKVAIDPTRHVVDWNLQLANALRQSPHATHETGGRNLASSMARFARDPLGKLGALEGKIVLLPGAGRPEKQWPVEHFRRVVARYPDHTVVVWGPAERALAEAIGGAMAPETDLRELAFVLRHASLVIGGDTGPLHLADALGTPVLGLFGPTDPARNGPYRQRERVLRAASMAEIAPEAVVDAIESTLRVLK